MVLVPIETEYIFLDILDQRHDSTLFLGLSLLSPRVLACLNISISVSLARALTPTRGCSRSQLRRMSGGQKTIHGQTLNISVVFTQMSPGLVSKAWHVLLCRDPSRD